MKAGEDKADIIVGHGDPTTVSQPPAPPATALRAQRTTVDGDAGIKMPPGVKRQARCEQRRIGEAAWAADNEYQRTAITSEKRHRRSGLGGVAAVICFLSAPKASSRAFSADADDEQRGGRGPLRWVHRHRVHPAFVGADAAAKKPYHAGVG